MTEEDRKKIEDIMAGITCSKDFTCAASGFETLCTAEDIGFKSHIECLEPDPRQCTFAMAFDSGHLCRCPVRVYLAKELRR